MEEREMHQVKHLISFLIISLISGFIWVGWIQPAYSINLQTNLAVVSQAANAPENLCVDTGQKIDLNNANLMAFMDCPGFYPNLARSIVQQGPYDQVDDVLTISDISEQQKQLLEANLDFFTVSTPVVPLEMRMPPRPAIRANP